MRTKDKENDWFLEFICTTCTAIQTGGMATAAMRCRFCMNFLHGEKFDYSVLLACEACRNHLYKWGMLDSVANPSMNYITKACSIFDVVPFKDHKPCGCNLHKGQQ
jgi:hypothetical protein